MRLAFRTGLKPKDTSKMPSMGRSWEIIVREDKGAGATVLRRLLALLTLALLTLALWSSRSQGLPCAKLM